MPPARKAPEPRSDALLFAVVAVVVAAAAVWLRVPALPLLWVGLLAATFRAQPPQLTGKGIGGKPEAVGPEVGKLAAYRRWLTLRAALLPGPAWNPWPFPPATLLAAAAAVAAWLLPTDLTMLWRTADWFVELAWRTDFTPPDIDTTWLPLANCIAAYVLVQAIAAVTAAPDDGGEAAPKVTFVDLWRIAKGNIYWYITCGLVIAVTVGGAVVASLVLADSPLAAIVQPVQAAAVAAALLVLAAFLHIAAGGPVRLAWQQRSEARQLWMQRFATIPKAVDRLRHVEHRRLGPDGTWWIDTFDVPPSLGAARDIINKPDAYRLAVGGDFDVAIVSTLATVSGKPQPNTRHQSRIDIITIPADATLDIADASLDRDQLETWLRRGIAAAAERGGVATALIDGIEPLHDPAAEGTRACWQVTLTHPDPGVLVSTFLTYAGPELPDVLQVEVVEDAAQSRLLIGEFDDSVQFLDDSLRDLREHHYRRVELEAAWKLTSAKFPAHPQFGSEQTTVLGGIELHRLPFAVPKGQPPEKYLTLQVEELATSLAATNAALTYFPDSVVGRRAPAPHKAAFSLVWTTSRGRLDPASIAPVQATDRRGNPKSVGGRPALESSDSNGILDLLSISIYQSFRAAKIDQPYIVGVKPLTTPDSRKHLWAIDLRLFGRVTIGQLRTRATLQVLQDRMEADYLRVVESEHGARLIVGALPETVDLLSPREHAQIVQADWEQAFIDTSLTSGGKGPTFIDIGKLEHNEKVDAIRFRLPGGGITLSKVRSRIEQLRSTTRNRFIDVRRPEGTGEDEVVVLACTTDPVPFPAPWDWEYATTSNGIAFGVGVEGEPCQWEAEDSPHVIVLGATRSGKSISILAIFAGALMRGWDLLLVDSQKGLSDFTFLRPYARAFATDPATFTALAKVITDELDARTSLAIGHGVANYRDLPEEVRPTRMLIAVDEFTSMAQSVGGKLRQPEPDASEEVQRRYQTEAAKYEGIKRFVDAIGRVLREGGAWGMSLMLAGQSLTKADADALGVGLGTFKNNSATFAIGAMRTAAYLSAFGEVPEVDLGEDVPRGRGIFRDLSGAQRVVQTWFDGPGRADNTASLLEHIAAHREPVPAEDVYDLGQLAVDAAESGPRSFGQVLAAPMRDEAVASEVRFEDLDLSQVQQLDVDFTLDDLDLGSPPDQVRAAPVTAANTAALADAPEQDDQDEEDWLDAFRVDDAQSPAPTVDVPAAQANADPFTFVDDPTEEVVDEPAPPSPQPTATEPHAPTRAPSEDPFGFTDTDDDDDDPFGFADARQPTEAPATDTPRNSTAQPRLVEDGFDDLFGGNRR